MRGGHLREAVPGLALPDGLVEPLAEGEVSLPLGALNKLASQSKHGNVELAEKPST